MIHKCKKCGVQLKPKISTSGCKTFRVMYYWDCPVCHRAVASEIFNSIPKAYNTEQETRDGLLER